MCERVIVEIKNARVHERHATRAGPGHMDGSEHATAGCVPQVNASIFFSLLMPAAVQQ